MLYKYHFIKKHKMHKLNQHLLYFIRKIKNIDKNAKFETAKYFHESFLNKDGKIAPNKRENKLLYSSFNNFFDKFKKLDQDNKNEFYGIILFSKNIHLYFEDDKIDVKNLHKDNIKKLIGDNSFSILMNTLWDSLKSNSWEIDKHYSEFFNGLGTKTCPFCGINQLPKPESYRADYDHLAFKGDYPISATNLRNLSPACGDCNQKHKNSKDVFYSDDKVTRRPFLYPYTSYIDIQIDLTGSILPLTDINHQKGYWHVSIIPDNSLTTTWNNIYNIKERYINDVLSIDYDTWLTNYIRELKDYKVIISNVDELKNSFLMQYNRYKETKLEKRYLIKTSLFKYFYECDSAIFYKQILNQIN